jgi:hypothetical protein
MGMIDYPLWLRRCIFFTAVIHDVAIMSAGIFAFREQPRTIMFALGDDFRLLWASMLLLGGVLALLGIIFRNIRWETSGCVLTSAAKIVWVVAALTPGADLIGTETLVAVLIAGASGTMWRFWGLYVGQYLRVRN